jgi:hypothetical protein
VSLPCGRGYSRPGGADTGRTYGAPSPFGANLEVGRGGHCRGDSRGGNDRHSEVRPAANAGIFQIAAAEARVTDRLLTAEFAEHLGLRRVFCVCATAETGECAGGLRRERTRCPRDGNATTDAVRPLSLDGSPLDPSGHRSRSATAGSRYAQPPGVSAVLHQVGDLI